MGRVEVVAWVVLDIIVPKSDEEDDLDVTVDDDFDRETEGVERASAE